MSIPMSIHLICYCHTQKFVHLILPIEAHTKVQGSKTHPPKQWLNEWLNELEISLKKINESRSPMDFIWLMMFKTISITKLRFQFQGLTTQLLRKSTVD